jgi:hypothetical protein
MFRVFVDGYVRRIENKVIQWTLLWIKSTPALFLGGKQGRISWRELSGRMGELPLVFKNRHEFCVEVFGTFDHCPYEGGRYIGHAKPIYQGGSLFFGVSIEAVAQSAQQQGVGARLLGRLFFFSFRLFRRARISARAW